MAILGPTTDHKEIRRWVESHGGCPVELMPQRVNHEPLLLRLYFGRKLGGEKCLRAVSWEDFFCRFDLMGLSFVYDDSQERRPHESYQILQIEELSPYRFNGRAV